MVCKVCGAEFIPKKVTQSYCNGICRRKQELRRKRWDMHLAYIELAEKAANCTANPESVRKMRGEWAKRARAKIGERP